MNNDKSIKVLLAEKLNAVDAIIKSYQEEVKNEPNLQIAIDVFSTDRERAKKAFLGTDYVLMCQCICKLHECKPLSK